MSVVIADDEAIKLAAQEISNANLVAFPTETVYGLGANAFDSNAVRKIFALKGRPINNPLIVHLRSRADIATVAVLDNKLNQQLDKLAQFWPGPLTVILPRSEAVAPEVNISSMSIAVRIPNHEVALKLIAYSGLPIAAPSANRSERVSPSCASHVSDEFDNELGGEFGSDLLILDGGACSVGIESTVLSLLGDPTILRPGSIGALELAEALGETVYSNPSLTTDSPGTSAVHYSPATRLKIRAIGELPDSGPAALIAFRSPSSSDLQAYKEIRVLSEKEDHTVIAQKIYATLRELDKLNLSLIMIDDCKEESQGKQSGLRTAIMDRLRRAEH